MLKKLGIPMMALAAVIAFGAPRAADARVRVGVSIGAPVYVAPVTPYAYPNAYADPYVDPYAYAPPVYVAPPPAYVEPYVSLGYGGGWRAPVRGFDRGYARGFDRGHEVHGHESGHGRR